MHLILISPSYIIQASEASMNHLVNKKKKKKTSLELYAECTVYKDVSSVISDPDEGVKISSLFHLRFSSPALPHVLPQMLI